MDQPAQAREAAERVFDKYSRLAERRKKIATELADLDRLSDAVHRKEIETQMLAVLDKENEADIDLARAALRDGAQGNVGDAGQLATFFANNLLGEVPGLIQAVMEGGASVLADSDWLNGAGAA